MSNLYSTLLSPFRSRVVNALFLCALALLLVLALLSTSSAAEKSVTGLQRDATASTAASVQVEYESQPRFSPQGLQVCGDITTDTTWTAADSPVVVTCNVTVKTGATLTVQPSVVVKIEHYLVVVEQNATLRAEGTAESPIYFTSIKDDSVGGDTNGDGGATLPGKGDWFRIAVKSSTTSSSFHGALIFDHVVVRFGGAVGRPDYGMLEIGGDAEIRNSVIEQSGSNGIYIFKGPTSNPTVIIENTTVRNNSYKAIQVDGP